MNEDEHARELGLKGITNSVEDIIVARDIMLSHDTGAKLHLCHCSTEDSVMMVDLAKQKNVKVQIPDKKSLYQLKPCDTSEYGREVYDRF